MSRCSTHHMELTDGKGKCSVPMWAGGCPAGFCDEDAFGKPVPGNEVGRWEFQGTRRIWIPQYVPGLACPAHGGPKEANEVQPHE